MAKNDEVPWLDQEEMDVWLRLMGVLIRLPNALDAQLRRDAGLSHFEYQILAALSMAEERSLRMTVIAEFAESSLSRLSHASRRLEDQGWVTRHSDPDDRRATVARLTDAGHRKVVEAAPGHVRAVRRLVSIRSPGSRCSSSERSPPRSKPRSGGPRRRPRPHVGARPMDFELRRGGRRGIRGSRSRLVALLSGSAVIGAVWEAPCEPDL